MERGRERMSDTLLPKATPPPLEQAEAVLKSRRYRDRLTDAQKEHILAKRHALIADPRERRRSAKTFGKCTQLSRARILDKRRLQRSNKAQLPKTVKKAASKHCLLVVRNNRKGGRPFTQKCLGRMRLSEAFTGVLRPNTTETLAELKTVEPFVFWGAVDEAALLDLLGKKSWIMSASATKKSAKIKQAETPDALKNEAISVVKDTIGLPLPPADQLTRASTALPEELEHAAEAAHRSKGNSSKEGERIASMAREVAKRQSRQKLDNLEIERVLGGSHGLYCIEDIASLLAAPHCDEKKDTYAAIQRFLLPFALNNLRTVDGVDAKKFTFGYQPYHEMRKLVTKLF